MTGQKAPRSGRRPAGRGFAVLSSIVALLLLWSPLLARAEAPSDAGEKNSCVKCHLDNEGNDAKGPAHLWPSSIHHENGIGCANCHGGDPTADDPMDAMNPDKGFVGAPQPNDVPDFCGKCHSAVRDNYKQSLHWTTTKTEKPVCTTCHTAHAQQRASLDLISETLCTKCHSFERAQKIKNLMKEKEDRIEGIHDEIDHLKTEGFDTRHMEENWFANRNLFHRLTHEVSVDALIMQTDVIGTDLGKLEKEIQQDHGALGSRQKFGIVMVAFFFLAALLFHLFRKTL